MKPEATEFFPQREAEPKIYAYELTDVASHEGYLKVGYTTRSVLERVSEQTKTIALEYRIVGEWSAMRKDGSGEAFSDHDVHDILVRRGFQRKGEEWFKCSIADVEAAILGLQTGTENEEKRTRDFPMREEQERAVRKTMEYFEQVTKEDGDRKDPKFLWNAKMRFGKTFATYQLTKAMEMSRVLVITFKPAVKTAWREDLLTHRDFEGWQFISAPEKIGGATIDEQYAEADKSRPIVCFGSFQDFLGEENGGIKAKNKWVHEINWDLIVFDEYHFGAWRDTAKKLFAQDEDVYEADIDESSEKFKSERLATMDETWLPITANHYLYLSGTPFRALNSGEFMEEQIFNWTYSDEQRAKAEWDDDAGPNPYAALPRMVMLAYKIPESISSIADGGEFNEFDLNEFFATEVKGRSAQFKHKENVQKWLDLIRGAYLETAVDDLKLGAKKPAMPFSDARLLNVLSHTLWFMQDVASCIAMKNLLAERQNKFYHDYEVIVCAGNEAGMGAKALEPVRNGMGDALKTKTITLSCGKLMTGVTVRPWTGIFMLRNLKSPETYFQAAFRVQSPWEVTGDDGKKEIVKKECYVFDFALDRALRQISDYSCNLDVNETNPEKKVADFIQFLPVLAYDGSTMHPVDAGQILDMAMSGTSATMLARKWESALLVNVDNITLGRIMGNKEAMDAILKIEGFRGLNLKNDIETIINKSEKVKQAKRDNPPQTRKEKEELSKEEKDYKSKRKLIQEKLIKFATRIPVFMYLTDAREMCLKEVISNVEPDLFRKVTGLEVKDFELLVSLNVFNESRMNEAVYYFKRYEDPSIRYAGVDKHESDERVGLFSTSISRAAYDAMAGESMESTDSEEKRTHRIEEALAAFNEGKWGKGYALAKKTDMKDAQVQYYIGYCTQFGLGTDKNEGKAIGWYQISSAKGNAMAQYRLGFCYELGIGTAIDLEKAFKWYKASAEGGDADGQYNVGDMYEYGKGVEKNLKEAFRWYKAAAENGNPMAQNKLGCCYDNGTGIEENGFESLRWFKAAAEQGDASAMYNVGRCYEYGRGVEKNLSIAREWYAKAAELGDEDAKKKLAELYERKAEDASLIDKAPDYKSILGDILERLSDHERQIIDFRFGITDGQCRTRAEIGRLYRKSALTIHRIECRALRRLKVFLSRMRTHEGYEGVKRLVEELGILKVEDDLCEDALDEEGEKKECESSYLGEALEAFKGKHWAMGMILAEKTDLTDARLQYYMGYCNENGFGTAKDIEAAKGWYEKAAGQGHDDANNSLLRLDGSRRMENQNVLTSDDAIELSPIDKALRAFEEERWYEGLRLAERTDMKDARIQFQMGRFYEEGYMFERNPDIAAEWYEKAAELGHEESRRRFNRMGDGDRPFSFPEDAESLVRKRCRMAAENGDAESQANWGLLLVHDDDDAAAIEWFRKSAAQNNARGQCCLGSAYEEGRGVVKDETEALRWYREAAKNGDYVAMMKLRLQYREPHEAPRIPEKELREHYVKAKDGNFYKRVKTGPWLPVYPVWMPEELRCAMDRIHGIGMKFMRRDMRRNFLGEKIFGKDGPEHEGYGSGELQKWADRMIKEGKDPYEVNLREWFKGASDALDYFMLGRTFEKLHEEAKRNASSYFMRFFLERLQGSMPELKRMSRRRILETMKQKYYTIRYAPYGIPDLIF